METLSNGISVPTTSLSILSSKQTECFRDQSVFQNRLKPKFLMLRSNEVPTDLIQLSRPVNL